ncbi:hypothetical protein ABEB36_007235 [Hypothenemus hampei]|uniref:Uncharacterized protein n=1 Tax=Hypothenemus hampei TaxID=57062 RepID=A0ABD1ETA2_HYPHA
MWKLLLLILGVQLIHGFIELYETEHAQQELADKISDTASITKAKELIDKMKAGIGGSTIAIHHPSGKRFIHRNKWMMLCHGMISEENGHCNGQALESLTAFKTQTISDYCYIKQFHSINETLCLSTHPVNMSYENNTVFCEATTEHFPVLTISIEDYLKSCEKISSSVTYIYFASDCDPEHVQIPNENTHVRCENFSDEMKSKKIMKKFDFAFNKTGICVFTEKDKFVLNLLQYLKQ